MLLAALLGACGSASDRLQITDLREDVGDQVELSLRLDLPAEVARGLARGVPLNFRCDIDGDAASSSHRRELRFLPLSRQYQLREPATGYSRSYDSRSAALAAMERWPLPIEAHAGQSLRARVYLDRTRLPAPLVLPALFDSDWRLDSGVTTWSAGQR